MEEGSKEIVEAKIRDFNERLIVPFFEEVKASRKMNDKKVLLLDGKTSGNLGVDQMLKIMHPDGRWLADLAETFPSDIEIAAGRARYVGHTMVIIDMDAFRAFPYAGKFLLSIMFRLGLRDEVYASPTAMYWMYFNKNLHQFEHRFDKAIADHRVEEITRAHVLNYMLDAFSFYEIHAERDEKPW